MNVKKICIILLKVMLIIFLVVSFNLIMMPKYINENQDGRIIAEMYREDISPDVIFLGSSTVYSGISPVKMYEEYGITSYVLASSSQTGWDSLCVLKEALKEFSPQMVVLDIGFLTTEEDYAEEVSNRKLFDYMRNDLVKYNGVKEAMATDIESGWSYLFPVLRYHTRYEDLSIDDFKYAYYKPDVTYNGYIMSVLQSQSLPEARSLYETEDRVLNDRNRKCLYEIINICKENGIGLFLIKTPSYQAKWGTGYETDISQVALQNGLFYVNFDNMISDYGINFLTDSPDEGGHLNLFGAEKFSYYLGKVIVDTYQMPDRRQDEKYNKIWTKKTNRYEADKARKIQNMY